MLHHIPCVLSKSFQQQTASDIWLEIIFFHFDPASWRAEQKVHVNDKEYAEEAALLTTHRATDRQSVRGQTLTACKYIVHNVRLSENTFYLSELV